MNTCLVEFEDGERFVTCRYYVRRISRGTETAAGSD